MNSKDVENKIKECMKEVSVIDPHCHLNPEKPAAGNLADILLYHHLWIEFVSSGMGQYEVTKAGLPQEVEDPQIEPFERVLRALKYLKNIKNTTSGLLLKWLLKDLYGVEYLDKSNVKKVFDIVEKKGSDKGRQEEVLDKYCGIKYCVTVESKERIKSERVLLASEVLRNVNLVDGKNNAQKTLSSMETELGKEIYDAYDFVDFLTKKINELPISEYKYLGAWVIPCITDVLATDDDINKIIKKVKNNFPLNHTEIGSFSYYGLTSALEEIRKTNLRTIQLFVGAEVLYPHRSITHWSENFCGALSRIACKYEDYHFNVSTASDIFTQDIAVLAKHLPNISVAGYWWHSLYPFYIKKALETRLDLIPANKIIGYFSDAYHCEWCYPKLKLVKQILSRILIERIDMGWYDIDTAIEIIHKLFYTTPKEIYNF